jgi:hypothetical protein
MMQRRCPPLSMARCLLFFVRMTKSKPYNRAERWLNHSRYSLRQKVLFVFVSALSLLGTGCRMRLFDSDCNTDADCAPGFGCDGFLATYCVRLCSENSDCPSDEYCDTANWFQRFPQCRGGCHSDDQCDDPNEICVDGSCEVGCHDDEQCPRGKACINSVDFFSDDDHGVCLEGCRNNEECAKNERCVCHTCVENGCSSNTDCSEGNYCFGTIDDMTNHIFSCYTRECEPLPEPRDCGDESCSAHVLSTVAFDMLLNACCPPDEPTACGLDVSVFGTSFVPCQVVSRSGVKDPDCPEVNAGLYGTFAGCRRSDGRCGVDASIIFKNLSPVPSVTTGLGCLLTR